MIFLLAGLVVLLAAALVGVVAVDVRARAKLEARITALALARTPSEYAGLLRAEVTAKVRRPKRKPEDDRENAPSYPIGRGGEW